jgi:hypothetical protein
MQPHGISARIATAISESATFVSVMAPLHPCTVYFKQVTHFALKRQRVEIRGRLEPMTVLTAEDPTVLAGLIDPQGQTTEAELEVA